MKINLVIIENFHYRNSLLRCRHFECDYTDLMEGLTKHEKVCYNRELACPSALTNQCRWRGLFRDLAAHIKEKKCGHVAAHPPLYLVRDKDKIVFRGSLLNRKGHNVFGPTLYLSRRDGEPGHFRPFRGILGRF